MNDFMELMKLRKKSNSNVVIHMFSNPAEYRECVHYYTGLLDDLGLLDNVKNNRLGRTEYNLNNGLKLILLLTHDIEKLHGYTYKTFRVFGDF